MEDLPDCLSPMRSSRWPLATGKRTSTTRIPVTTQGDIRERTRIDGDAESTRLTLRLNKVKLPVLKQNRDMLRRITVSTKGLDGEKALDGRDYP